MSENDQKKEGRIWKGGRVVEGGGIVSGTPIHPPFFPHSFDEEGIHTRAPRRGGVCVRPLARSRLKPDGARRRVPVVRQQQSSEQVSLLRSLDIFTFRFPYLYLTGDYILPATGKKSYSQPPDCTTLRRVVLTQSAPVQFHADVEKQASAQRE